MSDNQANQIDALRQQVRQLQADLKNSNEKLRLEINKNQQLTVRDPQQAEQTLIRFRAMMDQAGDAIFLIEPETGRFCDCNETACRMLGYTRQELIGGLTVFDVEVAHQNKTLKQWQFRVDMIKRANKPILGKGTHRRKDGTLYSVESTALFRTFGNQDYIVTVIRDVSDREILQAQLYQSQKMEALGQLASGMAHNFNNMLTVIMGSASLALARLNDNEPVRNNIEQIQNASESAADIVSQILAFARNRVVFPETVNLNNLVLEAKQLLRRLVRENIEIVVIPARQPAWVWIDPSQMKQVIANLALNASDAMPDGGHLIINVTLINLAKANAQNDMPAGSYVQLRVSDTGTGMSAEVIDRVFEPFFTTKPLGKGTGLGLSTCFGIIRQAHGYISVNSRPNKGTSFEIHLPHYQNKSPDSDKSTTDASLESAITTQLVKETILVVEDDHDLRNLMVEFLRHDGYSVLEAGNGEQALNLIEMLPEQTVDLLITDLVMPHLDGKQLARKLWHNQIDINVLFMSGYADRNPLADTETIDKRVGFIQKPFMFDELNHKIREVLEVPIA